MKRYILLALLLTLVLGVGLAAAQGITPTRIRQLVVDINAIVTNNLSVGGTSTLTGAVTATGGVVGNVTGNVTGNLTGNVTASTVTLNSLAFSGPVRYGVVNPVTNGGVITHGIGTTPTACIAIASAAYFTVSVGTKTDTTFVVNMPAGNSGGVAWFCGK
jgi:hypothetical protein